MTSFLYIVECTLFNSILSFLQFWIQTFLSEGWPMAGRAHEQYLLFKYNYFRQNSFYFSLGFSSRKKHILWFLVDFNESIKHCFSSLDVTHKNKAKKSNTIIGYCEVCEFHLYHIFWTLKFSLLRTLTLSRRDYFL